ncbi:PAS domain S-box protein, partial [Candidatus Poribacteria bacterium]|nr:PAS domain S-box protein [Candidatus Poribacteria bacterium]
MKMTIGKKVAVGFVIIVIFMVALALYTVYSSQNYLESSVGESSIFLAEEILKGIYLNINGKLEQLQTHSIHNDLHYAIKTSNSEYEKLDDIEGYINEIDRKWIEGDPDIPLHKLINKQISESLEREFVEFYREKHGYIVVAKVAITNKYGANMAQTIKTTDFNQSDEEWWKIVKNEGSYVGNLKYDEPSGMYAILMASRVDDENGNFLGVLKATFSVKGIIGEVGVNTKKYETSDLKIIMKSGKLLYSTETFRFMEDMSDKPFFKKISDQKGYFKGDEGGIEKLYSYATFSQNSGLLKDDYIVVLSNDVDEILSPAFKLRRGILYASISLITVGIMVGFLVSKSISRPIRKLSESTKNVNINKLGMTAESQIPYAEIKGRDEIAELSHAFNDMLDKLKEEIAERKRSQEERIEAVAEAEAAKVATETIEGMMDPVFITDNKGEITQFNRAFKEVLGYGKEAIGKTLLDFVDPEDVGDIIKSREKGFKNGQIGDLECSIISKDGKVIPVSINSTINYDSDNNPKGTISSVRDITQRKLAEDELKETAWKLGERMKEMNCLYEINRTAGIPDITLDEIFRETVGIIPDGWRHPGHTHTRIIFDNEEYLSDNFRESQWRIHSEILVNKETRGKLEIYYTGDAENQIEAFLDEELELAKIIAERLGEAVERILIQQDLNVKNHAIKSSINAIAISDLTGELTYVNQAFVNMWKYEDDSQILGRDATEFWEMGEKAAKIIGELQAKGSWFGELIAMGKEGGSFDVQISASMITDESGNPVGMMSSFVDITELKKTEAELLSERNFSESLVNSLPGVFYLLDDQGNFVRWNNNFLEVLEYSEEEMKSTNAVNIFEGQDREIIAEKIKEVFVKGESQVEANILSKSGKKTPFYFTGIRIAIDDSVYLIGVGMDITERRKMEKEMVRSVEELARSNEELEQFAYVVSHDLQEPLRKIQAFGGRLSSKYKDKLEGRGLDYLERMINASERMRTLINDLLTYSRLTTKANPFIPVDLNKIAQEVVLDLEARIEDTGGRIEIGELPEIDADPTQMRQLLQNLIHNGLKFHKEDDQPVVKVYSEIIGDQC